MSNISGLKILFGVFAGMIATGAVGCGKAPVTEIQAPFKTYVESFQSEARAAGAAEHQDGLIVRFGAMQTPTELGACELTGGEPPVVTIDEAHWALLTDAEREQLIYHELGHCLLGRPHNTALDAQGNPVSLMYPNSIDDPIYQQARHEYHSELFASRP